jgi:surfactin synthase thioesterase subunit
LEVPFAFFGHSMGAVLAVEVARALAIQGLPSPRHLVASARRPPHLADPHSLLNSLSDVEFVAEINRRYGGIPNVIRDNPDIISLLLPCLRADIAAVESYQPGVGRRLECPISAYGGADDALCSRADLEAWRDVTSADFDLRLFPGGHFYLESQETMLLAQLSATLEPVIAAGRDDGSRE